MAEVLGKDLEVGKVYKSNGGLEFKVMHKKQIDDLLTVYILTTNGAIINAQLEEMYVELIDSGINFKEEKPYVQRQIKKKIGNVNSKGSKNKEIFETIRKFLVSKFKCKENKSSVNFKIGNIKVIFYRDAKLYAVKELEGGNLYKQTSKYYVYKIEENYKLIGYEG